MYTTMAVANLDRFLKDVTIMDLKIRNTCKVLLVKFKRDDIGGYKGG